MAFKKNCVMDGASNMHAICVHTIHQKVKLTISGAKLYVLTEKQAKIYNYFSKIIFNVLSVSCYHEGSEICPGTEK
jgi:hypothetical protein